MTEAKDHELREGCGRAHQAAHDFIRWMETHTDTVGQARAALIKDFHRHAQTAAKLQRAVERPMCAGVFGPSQAGKSYLISALAQKDGAPLLADFGGEHKDFLRELNPPGDRESTGVVTRFTIRRPSKLPAGRPVELRLLTQTDIIKILGNTLLSDVKRLPDIDEQGVTARLDELKGLAAASPVDPLTADDVHDLREYFDRYFSDKHTIKVLRHDFWDAAAHLAPRLQIEARARLFSLLWGDQTAFTQLYTRLYEALRRLAFPAVAYVGLEAMTPERSIIDVITLSGLAGAEEEDRLKVAADGGAVAEISRSVLTALIAELKIVMVDRPYDFFEHTDLLDFPGYRAREEILDIGHFLSFDGALEALFLRGKVAYLFQRYREERELTAMLLCIGPSNQEVPSLAEAVHEWIADTHGATPEQRDGLPVSLFLILTKFDMDFEVKGSEVDPVRKWSNRLYSGLWNFLCKQFEWDKRWDRGGAFKNTFWLRNPNFKALNLFEFDYHEDSGKARNELAIRSDQRKFVDTMRAGFLGNADASVHFRDPERAWDAAFALNDGGISYIVECLRPVSNPQLKLTQISGQLERLRLEMTGAMAGFHIGGDPEKQIAKRLAAADKVVTSLRACAKAERFGRLLRQMQVSEDDLHDLYYKIDTLTPVDDLPFDRPAMYAEQVLAEWMRDLHDIACDERIARYFLFKDGEFGDLVTEIEIGAKRAGLADRIIEAVRNATSFHVSHHKSAGMPVRLTASIINSYVDDLGYDGNGTKPVRDGRPIFAPRTPPVGMPRLGPRTADHHQEYCADWVVAFRDMAERNARAQGGIEFDAAANSALGQLIEAVVA